MHSIRGKTVDVNGIMLDIYSRCVLEDKAQMMAEAGTNGYRGKGRNSGGRTYIRLISAWGDFFFKPVKNDNGRLTVWRSLPAGMQSWMRW